MRSSSLTTLVLLAVAASASPTPNSGSIQVRDTWVAPQRRSAFLKRAPGPQITEGGDIMDIESLDADQHSPFSFEMPADTNAGTVTFGKTASGEGLNARYPFFFKRSGHLEARDIEGLDARKAELERREAEINARAAELVAKREAAEAAKREEEELAKREAEELEAATIKKREALESIEARERELEAAKREYEEMKQRHLDLETAALAKRAPLPQFGNNGTTGAGAGVAAALGRLTNSQAAAAARLGAGRQRLTNAFGRLGGGGRTRLRRDEDLSAFDIDTEYDFLNKREPQFSFANLISSLGNGTAGGGAGGGAGAAGGLGRLNAVNAARLQQVSQLLSSFGFNFKRDEPKVVERDYAEELAMQKRQFSFASLLSSLGNGTAAGGAGGGAGAAGGLGRLNGVQAARLQQVSQLLSSLGFNFKRDEVEESFDHVFDHPSKRQFSFASLLSSLGNGTAAGGAGGGAGAAGGLGRLNGIQAARLQQVSALLSSLGFNFKRDEEFSMADLDEELEPEHPSKRQFSFASLLSSLGNGTAAGGGGAGAGAAGGLGRLNGIQAARLQQVSALLSSLGFNFKREYEEEIETTSHLAARAFPFNTWEVPQVVAEKRVAEPFGLDEFVMEKRGL